MSREHDFRRDIHQLREVPMQGISGAYGQYDL